MKTYSTSELQERILTKDTKKSKGMLRLMLLQCWDRQERYYTRLPWRNLPHRGHGRDPEREKNEWSSGKDAASLTVGLGFKT
ncbi:hypothetical protein TNCV_2200801 [Trichonephila clavipes]|nr:hypothetical protein TNCV_2200801 [Trichonephila clavipes]